MKSVQQRLLKIRTELPEGVALVAVSKFQPVDSIREAYETGQRIFGESRVQELLSKIPLLPSDIQWHFIGHLQTNKVHNLIGKITLIESVDSEKLLTIIDSESNKAGVVTNVLLQVHVAQEESKFGFSPDEILQFFRLRKFENLTGTHISGLMCMASNTANVNQIREEFSTVHSLFIKIKSEICSDIHNFNSLSMGMSGDWPLAVEQGANIVRIGSSIFGDRNYV